MLRAVFVFLAAAACLGAQDTQPFETRRHDIRSLAAALNAPTATFPFTASPVRPGGAGESAVRYLWGVHDRGDEGSVRLEDLLRLGFGLESEPADHRRLFTTEGGWGYSTGPAEFHDQVARSLDEMRRTLAPMVEVELLVLPPTALAEASSSVLDAAKADRLIEIAKPLASMRAQVRPGGQVLLEAVARRAYVKDYDVEVAQDSKAIDPLIDVIPEGIRAGVRVDSAPGGGFVLAVEGQFAGLDGPMRVQILNFGTPAMLQLPRAWWTSTSASARIENGGALLIGNDVAPRSAWMIRASGPREAAAPGGGALTLVPVGAAIGRGLATPALTFRSPNPSGAGAGWVTEAPDEGPRRLDRDVLLEQVLQLMPDEMADDTHRARIVGSHLVLAGDRKFVADAAELVAKAAAAATRGYSIEARLGTVPAAGFRIPPPDELAALEPALTQRAMTAAIASDRAVLLGGEAHAYLKDRDIEIAQAVTVDDPIVDVFFTGFAITCRAAPAVEGRCALDFRIEYQELLELSPLATGSKEVPETELPRIAGTNGEVRTDVALGSWTVIHNAPLEGTDRQLIVMIRINPS